MQNIRIEILEFNSKDQIQSIGLRYDVLRKPLGLFFDPVDLHSEKNETHIASFNGTEIIGVLLLKDIGNGILKMRQVAVSTPYQGNGIGKKMVLYAENIAIENGYHTMELHARERAVAFYLNAGYERVGERFSEVNIPHWKMIKKLN